MENIRHLGDMTGYGIFSTIESRQLLAELVDEADVVFHLAAAVGIAPHCESPCAPSKPT
jgi:hypothetical protein